VAIALRFGCPIYITEEILKKAGITVSPAEGDISSVSEVESFFEPEKTKYDTYSDEELYKIIDEAVKSEDYEKAAAVRDEIAKRRKKQE
jgi:bifunctional DNase/RNase